MTGSPAVLLAAAAAIALLLAPALSLFFGGLDTRRYWFTLTAAGVGTIALAGTSWLIYRADPLVAAFQAIVAGAAVIAVLSIGLRAGRPRAYLVFALVWVVVVLVPVGHALFNIERGFLAARFGTLDFAGAGVLAVCAGTAALSLAIVDREPGTGIDSPPTRPLWLLVLSGLLGGAGLVALALGSELVVDATSSLILSNMVWAMGAGTVGWTAAQIVNVHRPTVAGYAAGVLAGGVAALAGAPWLSTASSIVLGVAAGIVGHVSAVAARRLGAGRWATALGVLLVPGSLGILLLGMVARGSGLIFSGTITLLSSQVVGLAITLAYSFAASALVALVVHRTIGLNPRALSGLAAPGGNAVDGTERQ